MKTYLGFLIIAFLFVSILTATSYAGTATTSLKENVIQHRTPAPRTTGGPDGFGYTWIDSDEAGLDYDWIDISETGTDVEGLADDNVVGPFAIGFDFPYYWYTVTEFYAGSNGYIAFHDNTMLASSSTEPAFPYFPTEDAPNNLLGVLLDDLTFQDNSGNPYEDAHLYIETNNEDQCVISFVNARKWAHPNPGGLYTYQIVLSLDENDNGQIRYQYQTMQESGTNNHSVGIEDVTGTFGLEFYHYVNGGNQPVENLAVLFSLTDPTGVEIHDVTVHGVMNETNGGFAIHLNTEVYPSVIIRNVGNQDETDLELDCSIVRVGNGSTVYTGSMAIAALDAGEEITLTMESSWLNEVEDTYTIEFDLDLVNQDDLVPANNINYAECQVVNYPGVLSFCDDTAEANFAWNGSFSGYGVEFVPPSYPCEITEVNFYINSGTPTDIILKVIDDDGPNGKPGTEILTQDVECTLDAFWYNINLEPPIAFTDGHFYVAVIQTEAQAPYIGMDQTVPISRRTWEYSGGWSPSRDKETRDVMINVGTQEGTLPNFALDFNGLNDNVDCGNNANLSLTEAITIEAWINVRDITAWDGIISKWDNNDGGYYLCINPDGNRIRWNVGVGSIDGPTITANRWMHIAATYDGIELKIYQDGIETSLSQVSGSISTNTQDFVIGSQSDYIEYAFNGQIDDVRLWNFARSQEEIQADMYHILNGAETGLVGYWPMNEAQGITLNDLTVNANHGTINGPDWIEGIYYANMELIPRGLQAVKNGTNVNLNWHPPLTDSNLQYYRIYRNGSLIGISSDTNSTDDDLADGGYCYTISAVFGDESQPSNEACIAVGPAALDFDGSIEYAVAMPSPNLNLTDALTIEAWIYPTGWGEVEDYGFGQVIDKMALGLFLNNENHSDYADNSLVFSLFYQSPANSNSHFNTPSGSINLNTWQHLAAVYDAAAENAKVYINGIEQELTNAGDDPSGNILDNSDNYLIIGNISENFTNTFDGLIDELRVWNVVRSQSDISATMETYLSGNEQGLVGYWTLDEGDGPMIFDNSDNGNDGYAYAVRAEGRTLGPNAIEDEPGSIDGLPAAYALSQNYPNPFNPTTIIEYALPTAGRVTLQVYNSAGQWVRSLVDSGQEAGYHRALWDGNNQNGQPVTSGIYLYRIEVEGSSSFIENRRMVLLK
ncbi:MAG: T9SS type A sorting domain-containing protein [Planctomycetes bacterium]|nr:T9SS type A sorting domain-containing protein [Planctomycetota bacterium]